MVFPCDRHAIRSLLATVRPTSAQDLGVVHIKNTSDLAVLYVSPGCLAHLRAAEVTIPDPAMHELAFDEAGFLISPFAAGEQGMG